MLVVGWKVRIGILAITSALATIASSAPASAGPVDASSSAGSARFARQAAAADLSPAEARELQETIDGLLEKTGGVQVAANKIAYAGATLLVPLPGETRARELGQRAAPACQYGWLCLFSGPNLTGSRIDLFYCNQWTYIPWAGSDGSFDNNQTTGEKLGLRGTNGVESWNWPAHWIEPGGVRWINITHVNPCR